MSLFKQQVANDIKSTFINNNEFADEYNIDGVMLTAVIDRELVDTRDMLQNYERPANPVLGVYSDNIMMYIALSDLGYKPEEGQLMKIDGETYFVQSVAEDMGMLSIALNGNRS